MARKRHTHKPSRPRVHRRTPPGAMPGSVVIDPGAPHPRITAVAYGPEQIVEQEIGDPAALAGLLGQYPVTWINVVGLGDEPTLRKLAAVFGLHPLALEDIVHVHQRPKVDEYGEHLFIVARAVGTGARLETEQVSLLLGRNFVLTFLERSDRCLTPILERLQTAGCGLRSAGTDYLAYAILDAVIDSYFPALEQFSQRLDALEEEVARPNIHDAMRRIHQVRSDLLLLRRAIWPHREAVTALIRDPHPLIGSETRIFLRDCYDHTVQVVDLVETYREICTDLRDYWLSLVSTRMNEVMKWLTIIATIFIPLTFVVGLYGMNFDPEASPWNMPELKWRFGYPLILLVMAAVAVVMLVAFRRRGWLGPSWPPSNGEQWRMESGEAPAEGKPPEPKTR